MTLRACMILERCTHEVQRGYFEENTGSSGFGSWTAVLRANRYDQSHMERWEKGIKP